MDGEFEYLPTHLPHSKDRPAGEDRTEVKITPLNAQTTFARDEKRRRDKQDRTQEEAA